MTLSRIVARVRYQISTHSAALFDLPRVLRARASKALALFDPDWPGWATALQREWDHTRHDRPFEVEPPALASRESSHLTLPSLDPLHGSSFPKVGGAHC